RQMTQTFSVFWPFQRKSACPVGKTGAVPESKRGSRGAASSICSANRSGDPFQPVAAVAALPCPADEAVVVSLPPEDTAAAHRSSDHLEACAGRDPSQPASGHGRFRADVVR